MKSERQRELESAINNVLYEWIFIIGLSMLMVWLFGWWGVAVVPVGALICGAVAARRDWKLRAKHEAYLARQREQQH